jgi:hypothetical protein
MTTYQYFVEINCAIVAVDWSGNLQPETKQLYKVQKKRKEKKKNQSVSVEVVPHW